MRRMKWTRGDVLGRAFAFWVALRGAAEGSVPARISVNVTTMPSGNDVASLLIRDALVTALEHKPKF